MRLPTSEDWQAATPFPHVIVDDYWPPDLAADAAAEFPDPADDGKWHTFSGDLEHGKMEASAAVAGPRVAAIHEWFAGEPFLDWVRAMTDDPGLIADPERVGAGIHMMGRGARLGTHTDFSGMAGDPSYRRRVNVILFLDDGWRDEWGGALELAGEVKEWRNEYGSVPVLRRPWRVKQVYPKAGRLIVFESSDRSWHGVPRPLTCPEGVYRHTIPSYLFSPVREGEPPIHSTVFADA